MMPRAPVSWGELLDKIAILEIKTARIADSAARGNVARELALLRKVAAPVMAEPDLAPLLADLAEVNAALWEIEDAIRGKEARSDFDAEFIALARSVYLTNDRRSAIKRQINTLLRSELIEEKDHSGAH